MGLLVLGFGAKVGFVDDFRGLRFLLSGLNGFWSRSEYRFHLSHRMD